MKVPTRAKLYGVLAVVAISTPLALGFETGLRLLLFPPGFEDVRMWLRPSVTPWMWLTPVACALATFVGYRLQSWLVAQRLAKLPEKERTAEARGAAELDALLLATSAPQLPAVVATLGFMAGSQLTPVVVAMAVATLGVLLLGVTIIRRGGLN